MNLGFKATNLFINKTAEDAKPIITASQLCTLAEGDSGLNEINDTDVIVCNNFPLS